MWLLPSESQFKPPELQTFIFICLNARKIEYTGGIKDRQSLDTGWWERWMDMKDKDFFFLIKTTAQEAIAGSTK